MFEVGDKVYHIKYGWGVIEEKKDDDILSRFDEYTVWNNSDNNLLSFTEYTFQGFSQERPPIELPEAGELCLVRNTKDAVWLVRHFVEYIHGDKRPFKTDVGYWREIKRIKILD